MKKRTFIIVIAAALVVCCVSLFVIKIMSSSAIDKQKVSISFRTSFPNEYKLSNKGKIRIETPMVYELLNIVIALSDMDKNYSSLTYKQTPYYESVINHFAAFKDHPIVKQIADANEKVGYSWIRNLFAYSFDGDSIVRGDIYKSENIYKVCDPFIDGLSDFAKKSDFMAFYNANTTYYQEQNQLISKTIPISQIWIWLEVNFPIKHDAYTIIISPLTGGSHNTFQYEDDNQYSEIVMFISSIQVINDNSNASTGTLDSTASRMLFTEIDHNYVNPITNLDENIKEVVSAFSDIKKWNSKESYGRPALTFNEYMTWGTYLLYAHDTYQEDVYNATTSETIEFMNYRGFTRFNQFYTKLLELYINRNPSEKVSDLYTKILYWCMNNQ
jgi:hypothetical protein